MERDAQKTVGGGGRQTTTSADKTQSKPSQNRHGSQPRLVNCSKQTHQCRTERFKASVERNHGRTSACASASASASASARCFSSASLVCLHPEVAKAYIHTSAGSTLSRNAVTSALQHSRFNTDLHLFFSKPRTGRTKNNRSRRAVGEAGRKPMGEGRTHVRK